MGWFVLAAILGIVLYWAWLQLVPAAAAPMTAAACGLAALLIGLVLWAILVEHSHSFRHVVRALGHGQVARFLLGVAIGVGCAHVLLQGLAVKSEMLWVAVGITIIAVIAPSVDNWLSRVTSFKSSLIEVQLSSSTGHKVAVAEKVEAYADSTVLWWLATYNEKIGQDMDYSRLVELAELDAQSARSNAAARAAEKARIDKFLKAAGSLKAVFDDLISPLAACIRVQVESGMSLERVRDVVRAPSQNLQQIVLARDDPELSGPDMHERFWRGILDAAGEIDRHRVRKNPVCAKIVEDYRMRHPFLWDETAYPRIGKGQDLPYLYVAGALFMLFVFDVDVAVRLLDESRSRLSFIDYGYLSLLASVRYFQNQPARRVVAPLREMLTMSAARSAKLEEHCRRVRCEDASRLQLLERERNSQLVAKNNFALSVAEDLARGVNSARELEATAESFAEDLHKALQSGKVREDHKHYFRDTYAYTTVVIEAAKPLPNLDTFRRMARILQSTVEFHEKQLDNRLDKGEAVSRADYFDLNSARRRYQSARELAGE